MENDLTLREPTALEIVAAAARDPQVDPEKLTALLGLQERFEAREAEKQFNASFARLLVKMPRVKKNGTIDLGKGNPIPFARWEDVDAVIRPILSTEGFALSFLSEPSPAGVLMTGVLTHISGHSRRSTMQLPPDAGPGRNALQAIGSSHSYGKRYIAMDMLNIVCEGQDNDGKSAYPLTADQLREIKSMIQACQLDDAAMKKFLQLADASSLENIQQMKYEALMEALRKKLRQKEGAVK